MDQEIGTVFCVFWSLQTSYLITKQFGMWYYDLYFGKFMFLEDVPKQEAINKIYECGTHSSSIYLSSLPLREFDLGRGTLDTNF